MGTTTTSPANKEATPPTPASASPAATDATKGSPSQASAPRILVLFPDDVDANHRGFEITDQALIQQIVSGVQASKPTESFIGDVQGYKGPIDAEKMGKLFGQFSGGGSAASSSAAPAATDPKASAPAPVPAAKDAKADTGTAAPAPAAAKPADQPKADASAAKPADAPPAPAAAPAKT